jgi:hypothetical protein
MLEAFICYLLFNLFMHMNCILKTSLSARSVSSIIQVSLTWERGREGVLRPHLICHLHLILFLYIDYIYKMAMSGRRVPSIIYCSLIFFNKKKNISECFPPPNDEPVMCGLVYLIAL